MRWKAPGDGDVKIKKKFALLPITIGKETRWLEWVNIKYVYHESILLFDYNYWVPKEFIDEEAKEATNV